MTLQKQGLRVKAGFYLQWVGQNLRTQGPNHGPENETYRGADASGHKRRTSAILERGRKRKSRPFRKARRNDTNGVTRYNLRANRRSRWGSGWDSLPLGYAPLDLTGSGVDTCLQTGTEFPEPHSTSLVDPIRSLIHHDINIDAASLSSTQVQEITSR